jgi:hypothetical protein
MRRKAQNWATDVLIGTGIFVLGIVLFFYIVEQRSDKSQLGDLLQQIDSMSNSMVTSDVNINNPCAFVVGNKINKEKLQECAGDYNYSKVLLGVKSDYCIYFVDSNGNLLNISGITNNTGIGLGSSNINYTLLNASGEPIGNVSCAS